MKRSARMQSMLRFLLLPDRRDREVPGGGRKAAAERRRRLPDRQHRPRPRPRPGPRGAAQRAGGGLLARAVGRGLRAAYGVIQSHRSTLVFVNTRRLAERVAHHLTRAARRRSRRQPSRQPVARDPPSAEQRLKAGELKAIVATASLEMGIDIGYIDLVCQIGSPRADRHVPAARRPLGALAGHDSQGPAVPADARRAAGMPGPGARRPPRRLDQIEIPAAAARHPGPADRRRRGVRRMGRGRRCSSCSAAPGRIAT